MNQTFEATPAKLTHMAYCGMPDLPFVDDLAGCRAEAARRIRAWRRDAFPVSTLAKGRAWEISEPEDCHLVPDDCGTMRLTSLCEDCTGVTVAGPGWLCEDCEERRDARADAEWEAEQAAEEEDEAPA